VSAPLDHSASETDPSELQSADDHTVVIQGLAASVREREKEVGLHRTAQRQNKNHGESLFDALKFAR